MMGTYDLYIQHAFCFFSFYATSSSVTSNSDFNLMVLSRVCLIHLWFLTVRGKDICWNLYFTCSSHGNLLVLLIPGHFAATSLFFLLFLNLYKHNYCDCLLSSFKSPEMQICFYIRLSQWHWNTLELLVNLTILILPLVVYSEMQTIADSSRTGNMWLDVNCSWEFYCQRLTCCKEKLHVFILRLTLWVCLQTRLWKYYTDICHHRALHCYD